MQALAANPRITGAELLVQALRDAGTECVFGYPGGAIMPTYDALYSVSDSLHHVLVRHEQGAIHAAQGYARASGRTGVCIATSGPAAGNLMTGLMDALMDSTPLVCITGQVFSHLLGTDAFQEADIMNLSSAVTKWNYQITDPSEIPAIMAQAFRIASEGRPGPVLIDFTKDAQIAEYRPGAATPAASAWYQRRRPPQTPLDSEALQRAADLIGQARQPLLICGQGVSLAGAEAELRQFAETTGWPVASTLLGLSAFPGDHPLYVGMVGMHGNVAPNRLTNQADVILAVGMRFDDRVTGRLDQYATQARIIHIEIDPNEINRQVPAEVALVGDARVVLKALLPLVRNASHPQWLQEFAKHYAEEHSQVIAPVLAQADGALSMMEVVQAVSRASDGQAVIVSDVGQHQMMAARYYEFRRPLSHITSGGAGTMGFALPAAIGAKLASPQRQVIAMIGDGGFQMTLQELGTLAQEGADVKILILNNGYLGMVRQWQERFFDRRYSQVRIGAPDFVALTTSYGINAARVSERGQLEQALRDWLDAPGPALLEAVVAAEENVYPMIPPGAAVDQIQLS